MAEGKDTAPVTIKKYANRRLYNTATSSYVTLENLAQMVKDGVDFVVVDARSGDDITHAVLTQIIFEEESKGVNLLPIGFLRQLIGFYGDSLQGLVPRYLDHSMQAFSKNQEAMRSHIGNTATDIFSLGNWDDIGKQNMAMFERTMQMWKTPFAKPSTEAKAAAEEARDTHEEPGDTDTPPPPTDDGDFNAIRRQLEALQKQIDNISRDKDDR
ncbi:MAG: polyhydroxyalkanoate synthesis repressor PhaR [Alphaproteobacteria bacterium]